MSNTATVDPSWLSQYRKLEAEHGHYSIADDDKTEVTSTGKIKVTRAQLNHFRDLSRVPASPSPSPTPNPEFNP